VDQLSKGMAQKVQFISTVIARPRLLIFDEPFSGLDPVNADGLRDAVLDLRREGTTIVLSTHDMTVAERLSDRIFMIFRGEKVLDGTLDDIRTQFGQDVVRALVTGPTSWPASQETPVDAALPGRACDPRCSRAPGRDGRTTSS
jgi:ABC-2 type transport system ATP-binding protein